MAEQEGRLLALGQQSGHSAGGFGAQAVVNAVLAAGEFGEKVADAVVEEQVFVVVHAIINRPTHGYVNGKYTTISCHSSCSLH